MGLTPNSCLNGIRGLYGQLLPKPHDFMSSRTECVPNRIGHAVIGEESETHHTATSNSERARA
jgi:hypothetical protein